MSEQWTFPEENFYYDDVEYSTEPELLFYAPNEDLEYFESNEPTFFV